MSTLIQQLLKKAPSIFAETPVLFAYLYGSHAAGLPHPFSDLDIAIYAPAMQPKKCLDLELSLSLQVDEVLDHAIGTDVRGINHLPLAIQGQIITDGMLIYSRAEEQRIEFETRVRKLYFDFLPVINRYRRAHTSKL